jgi:hypothetical protein
MPKLMVVLIFILIAHRPRMDRAPRRTPRMPWGLPPGSMSDHARPWACRSRSEIPAPDREPRRMGALQPPPLLPCRQRRQTFQDGVLQVSLGILLGVAEDGRVEEGPGGGPGGGGFGEHLGDEGDEGGREGRAAVTACLGERRWGIGDADEVHIPVGRVEVIE